jgi:hypothetical protein
VKRQVAVIGAGDCAQGSEPALLDGGAPGVVPAETAEEAVAAALEAIAG